MMHDRCYVCRYVLFYVILYTRYVLFYVIIYSRYVLSVAVGFHVRLFNTAIYTLRVQA